MWLMPSMPPTGNYSPINGDHTFNIMAHPAIDLHAHAASGGRATMDDDYGEWIHHHIPDDRNGWHSLTRQFYDYWLSIAPPGLLPGRQHVRPEQMSRWLSRMWLLDVFRDPLRFRCRLVGSEMVRSIGHEVTGRWLDEVHPLSVSNPNSRQRFRIVAELGRPTWRRGPLRWARQPDFDLVESLLLPLAANGHLVDKIIAVSVSFDRNGKLA
jgi:hypothetical protein